jgi:hypothetical protein
MAVAASIAAGGSIVGGAMGGKAAKDAAKSAAKAQMRAQKMILRRLDRVKDPELKKVILENPKLMGQLVAEELGTSALEDIKTDPRLQDARMGALESLMQKGEEGLTAQDKAQYEEMLMGADAQEKARQATIQSQMAQRGALDSGAQLATQLASSQGSASNARRAALQMAADSAAQRASAQAQAGQLAGQIKGQDFSQQAQAAQARDAIARFNAANRQNVSAQNLAARQRMEDLRASNINQQQQLENQRQLQQFEAGMMKAGAGNKAISAGAAGQAKAHLQGGTGQAEMWSNLGKASIDIGKMFAGDSKNSCFLGDNKVKLNSGKIIKFRELEPGMLLENNNKILTITKHLASDDLYDYEGVKVTGNHFVFENNSFIPVKESNKALRIKYPIDEKYVWNIVTSSGIIELNGVTFSDWEDDQIKEQYYKLNKIGFKLSINV